VEHVSVLAFWTVWLSLAVQRLVEMWAARRTTAGLLAAGGRLVADDGYPMLVATHSLFFVASLAEAFSAPWAGASADKLTAGGFLLLLGGETLRGWAIASLGDRWTTRIVILPEAPLVKTGPYAWMPHPIYVGVTLMLVGFLVMFHLWVSLAVIGLLHAVSLTRRIQRESRALASLRVGQA
jgi:methyltransferase